jgi:DNA-binding CsgD family transcriptional regulator
VRDVGGALTFRDAGAAAALAAAVGRRSADAPIVLRIGRALGARPYGVVVTPCHRRILEAVPNGQPTAVLYVFDPEARPTPSPAMLRRLFGLTTTETEVALRLTAGRTASQVAADLGTSLATVRTHLRQLFDKTGTSRQAALVSLLVSLGAAGGE